MNRSTIQIPKKNRVQSAVKVFIYSSWHTKKDFPFLSETLKPPLFAHIRSNAKEKKIFIRDINASKNELHCSFSLPSTMSVSTALQFIKGESSRWVNQNALTDIHFDWEERYAATSIGISELDELKKIIRSGDWITKARSN